MKKIFLRQSIDRDFSNKNEEIADKKFSNVNSNVLNIVFVALFVAVIAVCSQIAIPFGQVPFTLQTLGVFVASSILGTKRGTISVLIYMLLGAIGLPVFSGFSGGVGILMGPTGGYIIGFIFTAFIVGIMTEKLGKRIWILATSMIIGLVLCYAFGTAWFCIIMKKDILYGLVWCVIPYLIPDAAKIALAIILVNRLEKVIKI